jgi:glycosyltransferase involved in cell wall biosynthesis
MQTDERSAEVANTTMLADQARPSAEPRKLTFVCGASAMAGAEHNMVRLIHGLKPGRWQVSVICPVEGELSSVCRQEGLDALVVKRARVFSTSMRLSESFRVPNPFACAWDSVVIMRYARKLRTALAEIHPDLVVTKGMFGHLPGAVAARALGIPCLWHVEDWVSERWWGLFRRVFGRLAHWLPTQIIGCADPIRDQMPAKVRYKLDVIYNGIDPTPYPSIEHRLELRQELGLPPEALVIGNVARMTPWKGQRFILEAYAQIAERYPQSQLLFVGSALFESDAFEQSLRRRTAELGLSDRVQFLGYRRDIPELLGAMDIFAYAAVEKDTGPLSVLEAMASRLPVIGFDIPGVRMFVSRPDEGLLVPVGQVDMLAKALGEVLRDSGLRRRLGAAARKRVEDCFSFQAHVSRFEQAFERAIGVSKTSRNCDMSEAGA